MVDSVLISILVGTVLGLLSGLGTGGGSLLMLWLTLVLHMDPVQARTINLMFFLPAASISALFHWRRGILRLRKILLPALAGCIMAAAFAGVSKRMDPDELKTFFGVLLIFMGIRELCYRPRKPK